MSKRFYKILLFSSALLLPNICFAQASFKIDGTTPKLNIGKVSINFGGRAEIDTYDIKTDFEEVTGLASRDYSRDMTALRRLVLNAEGRIGKNWKFRTEYHFMQDKATWTDAYLEYSKPSYSVYLGSNHQASPIEGQSPPGFYNFTQRSLVNLAFAQTGRNVGIAVRKFSKNYQITAAYFGDTINVPLERYFSRNSGFQVRATYAPINEKTNIFHFGGSFRYRERPDDGFYAYNARSIQFVTGPQNMQSGSIARSDTNFGVETFIVKGPLNIIAEAQINNVRTLNEDLSFSGAYADIFYALTGESRSYNVTRGTMGSIKPKNSVFKGGTGALAITGRIEYLDLRDGSLGLPSASIASWRNRGGLEYGYAIGINYYLAERVFLRAMYSETKIEDSRGFISNNGVLVSNPIGNGTSEVFSLRTQIGF